MKRYFISLALWGLVSYSGIKPLILMAEEKQIISLSTPPQAQISKITYYLKPIKQFAGGKQALHFEIQIRNVAEKSERFSVMVTTSDGSSAAGFIPAKAKKAGLPPVLEPKEEGKIILPLLTEKISGSFSIEIETAPQE